MPRDELHMRVDPKQTNSRALALTQTNDSQRDPTLLMPQSGFGRLAKEVWLRPDLRKRLQCMPDRDDLNDADSQANNRVSAFRR